MAISTPLPSDEPTQFVQALQQFDQDFQQLSVRSHLWDEQLKLPLEGGCLSGIAQLAPKPGSRLAIFNFHQE